MLHKIVSKAVIQLNVTFMPV